MRWANERRFDGAVRGAVEAAGGRVRPELVKAIIAVESGFEPTRVRREPSMGPGAASIGLMQLLDQTARGLGYEGPLGDPEQLTGLFDPLVNVALGVRYLDMMLAQAGGDEAAAASAYNGGYRPRLGFGALRTTDTPPVCLAWKPDAPTVGRVLGRDCAVIGSTIPGTFSNESYVRRVKDAMAYFFASAPSARRGKRTGKVAGTIQPAAGAAGEAAAPVTQGTAGEAPSA